MQDVECSDHLDENGPDGWLINRLLLLLMFNNFLVEILIVRILHHQAETRSLIFKKGFFVTDNGFVIDRGQNADLVQGVLLFLGR